MLNKEMLQAGERGENLPSDYRILQTVNRIVPPLLADLLAFALLVWLLPQLARQFEALGFFNSVLMGLFFLVFCVATVWIKRLQRFPAGLALPAVLFEKRVLSVLGVIFAFAVSTATAYVVGFLDSVIAINRGLLDEPSVTIYLLLTPASWLGLALIYMLILSTEGTERVATDSARYGLVSFLGLLGVNVMGLPFAAAWLALWARFDTVELGVVGLVVNVVLFVLLLGPPRLIYMSRTRLLAPVLTFLIYVVYLAMLATPM